MARLLVPAAIALVLLAGCTTFDRRCALVYDRDHCWNGVYDAIWPPSSGVTPVP